MEAAYVWLKNTRTNSLQAVSPSLYLLGSAIDHCQWQFLPVLPLEDQNSRSMCVCPFSSSFKLHLLIIFFLLSYLPLISPSFFFFFFFPLLFCSIFCYLLFFLVDHCWWLSWKQCYQEISLAVECVRAQTSGPCTRLVHKTHTSPWKKCPTI